MNIFEFLVYNSSGLINLREELGDKDKGMVGEFVNLYIFLITYLSFILHDSVVSLILFL